ncbi:MAG: hypothetical protein P1Q69_01895 [Candidatus Thorarchaeota archaeon]|nr:hypothetical protein [Candidatus Thorarchaeota archaeon]
MSLGAFFGVYWLAEWRGWTGTSHNMDYVPVFVYLKKRAKVWLFDYAVWDVWHYHTGSTRNPFNIFRHEAFEPFTGLTLTIDNPWHSMYRGSPALRGQKYTGFLALIFAATFSGAMLLIIEIIQYGEFAYLLPLLCIIFVASGILLARRPYPLLTMEEQKTKLTSPEARLDDTNKLVALWNLYEIKNPTFITRIRLRIVRARIRDRKKQLIKKLREFDRLRVLDGGPVGKIWNVYQMKGVEAAQQITSEEELTLKQQQELDSENLHEELELLDGYVERLEGYDRVKKNPRLVIVQKMQNPFNTASDFMDSFRDTEEHLYSLIPFEDDTRSFSR